MPPLLRRFSCARLYRFCMWLWPITFLAFPILSWLAKYEMDDLGHMIDIRIRLWLWIGIGVSLAFSRVACLAFS